MRFTAKSMLLATSKLFVRKIRQKRVNEITNRQPKTFWNGLTIKPAPRLGPTASVSKPRLNALV